MQDLLYVLPDTKTQNPIGDKNWERIPLPHAAAQTLGVRGVNYKIVINTFWKIEYWAKYSITINPCEKPLQQ